MTGQHEGDGQRAQIGGGDDRQIEAAGQQRHHHRQRQDAKLRHLERHRLQGRRRQHLRPDQRPEHQHQQRQQHQQPQIGRIEPQRGQTAPGRLRLLRQRGHAATAPGAMPPAQFQRGAADGDEDDDAGEEIQPVRRHAGDDQPVLQHRQQRHAEDRAEHAADPAEQAGAAEHDRGQHMQLLAHQRGRHHRLVKLRLRQRRDAGRGTHQPIGQQVEAEDVEAGALGGVAIAAERIDLPPGAGARQQQPDRDEGENHQQDLQVHRVGLLPGPQQRPVDAAREPVRQRVDVVALGEEHEQAVIDVQHRDGDDDARRCAAC